MLLGLQTTSQALDEIGSTRGSVLYRAATAWSALIPGSSGQVLTSGGPGADPTWQSAAGGSWTSIGAGSGTGTTSNGDSAIVYQVAQTTADRISWRFTESAAGVSTGTPALLQIDTVAASTAIPLLVKSRGTEVFRVSASTTQILAASGSSTVPSYSFASGSGAGMFYNAGIGRVQLKGPTEVALTIANTTSGNHDGIAVPASTANDPNLGRLSGTSIGEEGFFFDANVIGAAVGRIENTRWTAGVQQVSKASSDAVAYAINARKSRGTVASPTVVTSGDNLLTISGYGYVGATNQYQEAANITFDSTGTISDSATGIGGVIRFNVAKVGAEPAEALTLYAGATTGGGWAVMNEADADPSSAELAADDAVAIYNKNDKFVIAYNNGGTMTFISIPLDGSTTTWTHSTTPP